MWALMIAFALLSGVSRKKRSPVRAGTWGHLLESRECSALLLGAAPAPLQHSSFLFLLSNLWFNKYIAQKTE